MSVLSLQTFVRNGDISTLQEQTAQLLSLIENSENIHDAELVDVKKLFIDVYGTMKCGLEGAKQTLNAYNRDDKNNERLGEFTLKCTDIHKFLEIIEHIKEKEYLKSENEYVITLSKLTVLYVTIGVVYTVGKTLVDTTLDILDDINYYECILARKYTVMLYFLQTLPTNAYNFLTEVKGFDAKVIKTSNLPQWLPEFSRSAYLETVNFVKVGYSLIQKYIDEFIKSPTTFILEKQQDSRSLLVNFWNCTFSLPYYYSKYQIQSKRRALVGIQQSNVAKLGYLLYRAPRYDIQNTNIDIDLSFHDNLLSLLREDDFTYTTRGSGSLESLVEVMSELDHFKGKLSAARMQNGAPSYWTRNWPIIVPCVIFTLSYMPSTFRSIHLLATDAGVRRELADYLLDKASFTVDTIASFWQNWIVDPINNILKTIRHDDTSKIALMSQKSLDSDLQSLERMVLDYVRDSQSDADIDFAALQEATRSGDMTVVMSNYERDLKSPVKSIILGDMVRNILIQIQKTKVDGSLALNGVDQILKSQELVFGFVAASPSLFILWALKNSFMSWYNGESYERSRKSYMSQLQSRMSKSLGTVEKLVGFLVVQERGGGVCTSSNGESKQDYYKNGLIFIELKHLKALASQVLPVYMLQQFNEDLEDLIQQHHSAEYKLFTVQRIWNVYGRYLR